MAKHRENMLEAFRASTEQTHRAASDASSSMSRAGARRSPFGTLFGRRRVRPDSPAGSLPPEGLTLPMGALPFLVLQLAALALVFLMGYFAGGNGAPGDGSGDDTVHAAGGAGAALGGGDIRLRRPAGDRNATGPSVVGPARADPDAPTALDRDFLDPAHAFTVSVFSADDTEYGRGRIRAVRDHLLGLGYPAVIPPTSPYPDRGVVCAGASASQNDLLELRDRLRLEVGLDGRGRLCQDAWVDNIKNYR